MGIWEDSVWRLILQVRFGLLVVSFFKKIKLIYSKIFTDGSKIKESHSSWAVIYNEQKKITTIWKLPRNAQILEAELYAIKQGLKYMEVDNLTNSVIFTDSLSSILILQNLKPNN